MTDASGVPDLELTRVMAASPEAIWAAWTDPAGIAQWWGPAGFTSTVRELNVVDGGRFDVVMHAPDGTDFANVYIFEDVEPARRISYVHQGSEEWGLAPSRSVVLIEAETQDAPRTRVTVRSYYASDGDRRRHLDDFQAADGARQLLERLEEAARSG
ncbi:SRPBCC domain-containing protein [Streptomyces triticagri]|nr:SRPBCC domain-containing protein [Streptomyces triticagri]